MAPRAEHVSLLFDPGDVQRVPPGLGSTLAGHLVGYTVSKGERVCLPGWPDALVEDVHPDPGRVESGTEVTLHVPPGAREGPLSLVIVVDASLTMGKGSPSRYSEAATLVDALLLNGRSFTQEAGLILQGGDTRNAVPLRAPDEVSGASILKIEPRGTFDLDQGLHQALTLLEDTGPGPRAIVVITDEDPRIEEPLDTAGPLLRAGTMLSMIAPDAGEATREACRWTGGLVAQRAEPVFDALAELAQTRATWTPPEQAGFNVQDDDPHEFEVVIEAVEGSP